MRGRSFSREKGLKQKKKKIYFLNRWLDVSVMLFQTIGEDPPFESFGRKHEDKVSIIIKIEKSGSPGVSVEKLVLYT